MASLEAVSRFEVDPSELDLAAGVLNSVCADAGPRPGPCGSLGAGEMEDALGSLSARAQQVSAALSEAAAASSRALGSGAAEYTRADVEAMPEVGG